MIIEIINIEYTIIDSGSQLEHVLRNRDLIKN